MGPFSIYKNGDMPLNGEKSNPLVIRPGFPARRQSSGWKDSRKGYIKDGKNLMLFQSIRENKAVLTKSEYYIHEKEDLGYRCYSEAEGIELQFCLEGDANFEMKQSRKDEYNWRHVMGGKHNMQTFNGFINDVKFKGNSPVIILNIEITLDRLSELAAKYPILAPIENAVKEGKNSLLFKAPRESTNEMHLIICEIFDMENQPERDQIIIDGLIDQLMACVFEHQTRRVTCYPFSLTEKFYNAQLYLNEHFKQPKCSIENARLYAGINQKIFTTGFKKLFKCSPSRYLKQIRLDKAKEIILLGEAQSLNDVCMLVGLKKNRYFIAQYELYHGVTPQVHYEQLRNRLTENQ